MRTLDVASREAYLAWVSDWKEEWQSLVVSIRDAKHRKQTARDQSRLLKAQRGSWEHEDIQRLRSQMWDAYYERERLRWRARRMIELRLEGKRESWAAKMRGLAQPAAS